VDEVIAAEARKLDAFKTHKKGLMQELFPREGETQPRLRFPEFQDAREWDEHALKNVFSILQGFAFSSNDSVDEGVRWLKIADVSIQRMNHHATSYLPIQYQVKFSKVCVIEGDYVIALTRPILNRQLKMAQVDQVFDGALLNQRVGKLVTTQYISFVYFLLQTSKVISDIEKSISGTEPPNLSPKKLEDLKTYIPERPEQKKIADCLSSLDDIIAFQVQKLEALKTHKKGLMQQLFPSPEEEV
jgi:type I restriction enzyme S subunit